MTGRVWVVDTGRTGFQMRPSAIKVWFLFLTISERISNRVSEHSFCRDTNISRSIDCILETIRLTTPEGETNPQVHTCPCPLYNAELSGPLPSLAT